MFKRKKKPQTSTQKAQKAQLNIIARILACGYLLYIIHQLVTVSAEESGINPTLRMGIIIVFTLASAAIITVTIIEFVQKLRGGNYKESFYDDDPLPDADSEDGNNNADGDSKDVEDGADGENLSNPDAADVNNGTTPNSYANECTENNDFIDSDDGDTDSEEDSGRSDSES